MYLPRRLRASGAVFGSLSLALPLGLYLTCREAAACHGEWKPTWHTPARLRTYAFSLIPRFHGCRLPRLDGGVLLVDGGSSMQSPMTWGLSCHRARHTLPRQHKTCCGALPLSLLKHVRSITAAAFNFTSLDLGVPSAAESGSHPDAGEGTAVMVSRKTSATPRVFGMVTRSWLSAQLQLRKISISPPGRVI